MFEAALYHFVYLVIVVSLTIIQVNKYAHLKVRPLQAESVNNRMPLVILTISMILYIGFRPISGVFVDMRNYETLYNFYQSHNIGISWDVDNKIYENLFRLMAISHIDIRIFFLTMAVIYIGCMGLAMWYIFSRDAFYALIIFLAAFSTFSYGTNGLKAGAAASIFLLALATYPRNKLACVILIITSYGFHHSMQLPIAAFVVCSIYKNTNAYMLFWVVCLLISIAHITYFQMLFGTMTDEQGAGYLMNSAEGVMRKSGFRWDFVIYSAIPIAIGWWTTNTRAAKSKIFSFYFNIYLFVNATWLLCMYAPFTNRIAYLSWQILPLVSIYPFFKMNLKLVNQYSMLNQIVLVYLAFTVLYSLI